MLRQRQKKSFPPGTFIPTPARICAIIQLCLAFSLFLWIASEPFIGEIFTLKSRLLFYQDVMGIAPHEHMEAKAAERLDRNAERFKNLSKQRQMAWYQAAQSIQKQLQAPPLEKIKKLLFLFTTQTSPYELAWIVYSIAISIMLLKKTEGAAQAVWLLPFLTALYATDVRWFPARGTEDDLKLFPTEQVLVDDYVQGALSKDILEQHTQLLEGWKRYLIINWAKETPSANPNIFDQQAEEGEFRFTLARFETDTPWVLKKGYSPPSLWVLVLYFCWNIYFAYTAWKHIVLQRLKTTPAEIG